MNCKNCNKTVSNNRNIFCSQSCAAIFNNKARTKFKPCKYCGKKVPIGLWNSYCSTCIKEKVWSIKHSLNECKTDHSRKKFLLKKNGLKCNVCNRKTWNKKPIPIELDHIDGNHQNNSESNLRLICPNCHAQTPTYKNRNKGNGRKNRRERYHKNKELTIGIEPTT